ncbi:hypothetical protein Pcaca05_03880 [Pectobacterium carotovorum subsp. carotovorum]|nr:hypothetical protein Pcaca05_03880 [Pectobacterium carotovorum subsp. carotovorum]
MWDDFSNNDHGFIANYYFTVNDNAVAKHDFISNCGFISNYYELSGFLIAMLVPK